MTNAVEPSGTVAARACPVCATVDGVRLHRQMIQPVGVEVPFASELWVCASCGCGYMRGFGSTLEIETSYREGRSLDPRLRGADTGVSPWDAERFEAVATLLAGHLGRLGRDLALARACDIGCGGGGLLVALRAQGVGVVVGVDLAEANVRLARAQAAVVAHTGSIDEVPDEMGLFDLVTVSHVAEHMVDPVRDLRVIAARTAPDGLIYVEVPDARGFSSYAAEPMREINIEHVNHFSPMTLRLLLESTGYAVRAEGSRIMHMGGSATPAVWAIGQRANHPPVTRPTLDTSLVDGLVEYLETSGAAYMELAARVAEVCRRHRHVKVWGASYVSEKLLGDGVFAGVDVVFVDGNPAKQGQLMGGAPVGPVEWLAHGTAPVVLTSASYEPEMLRRLRDELHHHGEVVSLSGAGRTAQGGEDHRQPR